MTFGDVLAIIAVVLAVVASLTTATVLTAVVFNVDSRKSIELMSKHFRSLILRGVALTIMTLFLVVFFHVATHPLEKLILALVLAALAVIALYGSSVLASVVGYRTAPGDNATSESRLLYRGALICLVAGIAPLVGWFVITPAVLVLSFGAGSQLIWPLSRRDVMVTASAPTTNTLLQ